jgi:hypothetical protein
MSAEPDPTMAPATEPTPVFEDPKPASESGAESKPIVPVAEATPIVEESKPTPEPLLEPKPAASSTSEKALIVEESKPTPEPASEPKPAASSTSEKAIQPPVETPLSKLFTELPSIIKDAGYGEMWGIELEDASHVPTTIVLEKFLRANTKDTAKAKTQLTDALKWRKKMQPMNLLADTEFDASKFGDLGYVTVYPESDGHGKEIVTWNIYGAVKNNKATFGDVEEYMSRECNHSFSADK